MIAQRLTQARREIGLDQQSLSRQIGVSKATISRIESGERKPGGKLLVKLADILGVTTDWLLGRDAPERGPDWQVLVASWPTIKPAIRAIIAKIARDNAKGKPNE